MSAEKTEHRRRGRPAWKLNLTGVAHIRLSKLPVKVLAIDYRVSEALISQIRHGKRWPLQI